MAVAAAAAAADPPEAETGTETVRAVPETVTKIATRTRNGGGLGTICLESRK